MIKVLIAEDSAAARGLIGAILESDPEIKVVGRAVDGAEAVKRARELKPDLVTMDIHMPVMDGLQACREIMAQTPLPIVIVSATTRVRDTHLALEALRAGALALIAKPEGPGSEAFEGNSAELIATVKAMAAVKVVRHRFVSAGAAPARRAAAKAEPPSAEVRIVAIAGSTGAPAGLQRILSQLGSDFPVPVVIVQHIAHGFTDALAHWLDGTTAIDVTVARDGETLRPGRVVIAPDDRHLTVTSNGTIRLTADAPEEGFRPSGSPLFRSVADAYGSAAAGVILSGMGADGVAGLRALHARGGHVVAQDEGTSVVYGMPAEAAKAGVTDAILPLDEIGTYLKRLVGRATT
jgi:two-component system chemotaxis response regulator CheB